MSQNPSRPPTSADVFVLRHGERVDETRGPEFDCWYRDTQADAHRRFDPPLTARGLAQAATAAAAFAACAKDAGIGFDVIYCSPTQRCVSTAAAFSVALGAPIACVPALAEVCAALRVHNPSAAARWPLVLTDSEFAALNPNATFQHREREATPGPVFMDGTGKLGRTCAGDLAAAQAADATRKGTGAGRTQVLLCSHREAIRDLASFRCGLPTRLKTAYCCIAQFKCDRPGGAEGWDYAGMFDAAKWSACVPPPSASGPSTTSISEPEHEPSPGPGTASTPLPDWAGSHATPPSGDFARSCGRGPVQSGDQAGDGDAGDDGDDGDDGVDPAAHEVPDGHDPTAAELELEGLTGSSL